MTFKHVKFEDSPTMRALERVAKEKGLVKPEAIQKSASISKKADYTPSSDFMENIFKLCSGLRAQGLEKEASEIEVNYLNYKRAQTLYETSKETGEDLVQSAHPKGSHKLEGVEGEEATVEDILDQHMKMLQVIEKKPHGKLASSKEVIDSVRMVLGESFLENGRANSTRKIAQTAPAKEPSNVGTEVATGVGVMGGVSLLKYVFNKLKGANALDAKTVKDVEQQMARGLTKAEADVVRKQVLERATKEGVERAFGAGAKEAIKDVGIAGAKEIAKDVGVAGAKEVAKDVAVSGATRASTGLWGRLLGWGSTALAGADTVAVGGAAGSVGSLGALAAAVLIGAIGGAIVGNALFEHYLAPDDLKDAAEKLIEKSRDLKDDLPKGANDAVMEFQIVFNKILQQYPVIKDLQERKDPKDLPKLKELSDQLWKSHKLAMTIWGWAQSAADDSWKPRFFTGPSDVVALSKNYMDRVNELTSLIDKFVRDANQTVETKMKERAATQVASQGGSTVVDLKKGYTDTLSEINKYKQIIQAKRLPNADALIAWLSKVETIINGESSKFAGVPDVNKPDVTKFYSDRLNNKIKPKIKAFADKWMT